MAEETRPQWFDNIFVIQCPEEQVSQVTAALPAETAPGKEN